MKPADAHELVEEVGQAWVRFMHALSNKGKYPQAEFNVYFTAVKAYAEANAKKTTIHKEVAMHVNGLREYLAVERKRVPGQVLFDADRLEYILFAGYDPYFEGDEPPGL